MAPALSLLLHCALWLVDTTSMDEPADKPVEAQPRVKRRWYQFSLWSIFVWVAVVGVLLAIGRLWVAPAQRQQAAVQKVERIGGIVEYVDPPTDENWLTTRMRNWLPRDYFDSVERVDLDHSSVTDADVASLGGLTKLQRLDLRHTGVTDAGLTHMSRLTELQWLKLDGTRVSGPGLAHLSGLPLLKRLYLGGTRINDAGLAHLCGMTQVERLFIRETQITDAGLMQVGTLKQLQALSLHGTEITDAGLAHLTGLTQLRRLWVSNTRITDTGEKQIRAALPACTVYRQGF